VCFNSEKPVAIIGGGSQRLLCGWHNVLATATQSRPNCVEQHFITKMACEGRQRRRLSSLYSVFKIV
jgi:hypothetical protein